MESIKDTTNKRNIIIGAVLISVVVIAFGIYGIGVLFDNLNPVDEDTNPDDQDYSNYTVAPALNMTDIDDQYYELEDFKDNISVILYFHFLGCSYCGYHGPRLEYVTKDYSPDQVKVFAITIDADGDTDGELITWSNAHDHDTWILVRDFGNHLRTAFSVTGAPTTVFINKAGYVTYNIVGLQTSDELNAALVKTLEIE